MREIVLVFFILCSLATIAQKQSEAVVQYDKGVSYFKTGKLDEADSAFTLSLKLEPNADTFYNKALVKKKQGNLTEYCNNLEYAMWYGDKESGRLFDSDCNNVDSFFVTQNYSKADAQNYFYKLRFVKSKYSSQQEFYRYDKENNLDLAYEIYKNDTSYIKLPKQYMDSVVKLIMNPINKTIANNCVYPKESKNHNISGTVYVQFYINKVGKVETTRIMRAPMYGEALAIETLNLFSLLPQFKPFIYQGRPIRLKLQLPVKFTLK